MRTKDLDFVTEANEWADRVLLRMLVTGERLRDAIRRVPENDIDSEIELAQRLERARESKREWWRRHRMTTEPRLGRTTDERRDRRLETRRDYYYRNRDAIARARREAGQIRRAG